MKAEDDGSDDGNIRVEQLSGGGTTRRGGSGVSAQTFLRGIWAGRAAVPPPMPTPEPVSAPAMEQSTLEAAFDSVESGSTPGEPSRPAQDHISLDSVFGDDSARRQTAPPDLSPSAGPDANPSPATTGGFSFDDFFQGGAAGAAAAGSGGGEGGGGGSPSEPGGPRTPGRSSGRAQRPPEDEVEADQFQQWLKKLKS